MKMRTLIFANLILLIASGVIIAQGQQTTVGPFSDTDKVDMIETVLDLELRVQAAIPGFANIRTISSDNIEFIEPSRLSKRGFTLVVSNQVTESKKDHVVEYQVFRRIYLRDGAVVLVLSRVTEGRPWTVPVSGIFETVRVDGWGKIVKSWTREKTGT